MIPPCLRTTSRAGPLLLDGNPPSSPDPADVPPINPNRTKPAAIADFLSHNGPAVKQLKNKGFKYFCRNPLPFPNRHKEKGRTRWSPAFHNRFVVFSYLIFLRKAATPIKPVPSRRRVMGSGTRASWSCLTPPVGLKRFITATSPVPDHPSTTD